MTVGSNPPKLPETSLPMVQPRAQPDRVDRQKQEALNDVIRKQVMHVLGAPDDLLAVAVRPLWGRFYRVNIFVGPEVGVARVANSFFLEIDGDGKIAAANPKITRQYGGPHEPTPGF
jgi:hypothetical protein